MVWLDIENMATNLESVPIETIESLQRTLTDVKVDIPTRFRSIFTLKAIKNKRAIDALAAGIWHSKRWIE